MTTAEWIYLGTALLLTIFAGIMVALDAAIAALSHARALELVEEGRRGAVRAEQIEADPAPYVNATLFARMGATMITVVLVCMVVFAHFPAWWERLTIAGVIMIVVSFIAWGVAPRTLGQQHAAGTICRFGGLLAFLSVVFGPISAVLIWLGNLLTPGRGFTDGPFASEAELRELVDKAVDSDVIEAGERKMIHSVFDLGDTLVREVMVPRPDMVIIEQDKTIRQALSLALRSGFSRIPVIGKDTDDVVGVLYLKDVIRRVYDNADAQTTELASTVMRPVVWCPDSKPVDDLLRDMQRTRTHLAMVVDEFGGTAGLVTIEDILEEIVGEIVDEYDDEVAMVTKLADDRFRVSSRLPVDELGELFGLRVDDDDVDTVGGLMAKELTMVPIAGSVVHWEGLELTAERSSGRRNQHRTVLVTREDTAEIPTEAVTELAAQSALRES